MKILKNMKFGAKLGLSFGIVLLILGGMGLFSINRLEFLAEFTQKL